jgi:hypothetical protein
MIERGLAVLAEIRWRLRLLALHLLYKIARLASRFV